MNSGLTDGLSLMAIGMGTVLLFLCILIISMQTISKKSMRALQKRKILAYQIKIGLIIV